MTNGMLAPNAKLRAEIIPDGRKVSHPIRHIPKLCTHQLGAPVKRVCDIDIGHCRLLWEP